MKKFIQEFKEFAMKGNVMDMAIGIIIGAAFGKIVTSLVNDILMPPIGLLFGNMDFAELAVTLNPGKVAAGAAPVLWKYGSFIQTCIDFLIIALCIFMIVKAINSMRRKKEEAPAAPPAPTKEETLLTEIRDLLAKGKK